MPMIWHIWRSKIYAASTKRNSGREKNQLRLWENIFETLLAFENGTTQLYVKWLKTLNKDSKIVVTADERPYPKDGKFKTPGP